MTTIEVMVTALMHGWRWESLGPGLEPVLTNAPPDQYLCVGCGRWQPLAYRRSGGFCQACISDRNRIYNPRRRWVDGHYVRKT